MIVLFIEVEDWWWLSYMSSAVESVTVFLSFSLFVVVLGEVTQQAAGSLRKQLQVEYK